jgi:hypothetical protein
MLKTSIIFEKMMPTLGNVLGKPARDTGFGKQVLPLPKPKFCKFDNLLYSCMSSYLQLNYSYFIHNQSYDYF